MDTYRLLGGIQRQPTLAPGKWDLSFSGFVLELDEELHFNRYRHATLSQGWPALPWSSDYTAFSADHEDDCVRAGSWGKRWTTTSTEAQFGRASQPKEFTAGGAPRWKQRALYDYIKDVLAASGQVSLVRLSVHDRVGDVTLDAILGGRAAGDVEVISHLVERRTSRR